MRIAVIVFSELVAFIVSGVVIPGVKVSFGIEHITENPKPPTGTTTGGITTGPASQTTWMGSGAPTGAKLTVPLNVKVAAAFAGIVIAGGEVPNCVSITPFVCTNT